MRAFLDQSVLSHSNRRVGRVGCDCLHFQFSNHLGQNRVREKIPKEKKMIKLITNRSVYEAIYYILQYCGYEPCPLSRNCYRQILVLRRNIDLVLHM